jgi:hypothetical protein
MKGPLRKQTTTKIPTYANSFADTASPVCRQVEGENHRRDQEQQEKSRQDRMSALGAMWHEVLQPRSQRNQQDAEYDGKGQQTRNEGINEAGRSGRGELEWRHQAAGDCVKKRRNPTLS